MKPRFVLDEHISPEVARGATARGVDVVALGDAGLLRKRDEEILRVAAAEGRIAVTYNVGDFAMLVGQVTRERGAIPGVIFVNGRTIPSSDVETLVKALVEVAGLIERGEANPSGGLFLSPSE